MHFGYKGQTRFFQSILGAPRYAKMLQPNPVPMSDGTFRRPCEVEVTFYLDERAKEKFMVILPEQMRKLGIDKGANFLGTSQYSPGDPRTRL